MAVRAKLRGAISGFGEVAARAHLPGWRTRENVAIGAIHDPVSERRHDAIRLIKNVRVYDDLELMLDGEAPDFVDVASPPGLHHGAARAALAAGAHVLVEKPLALTLSEFDELAALAAEKRRVLMCVHNWKYAPAYMAARKAIEAGRLGAVRFVSIDRLRTAPAGAGGSGGKWRSSAASGGGILIDHGWHVFYLMNWLLGGDAPVSISARLESPASADVDDVADLRIRFESGALSRVHLSWRAPVRRTSALIYGERASLEIEGDRVLLTDRAGKVDDLSVADMADDSYHSAWFGGVAEEFELAVTEGTDSPIAKRNVAEARVALMLMEAARKSSINGGVEIKLS
ncbi:MAG: Gfo/Idh/MocA family oxidoreductase [Candidatus Binatus sp.]|jgi:UDP-N-acetyl-2-amino-2-deoxyglucuronate dehydrogenase|uniref:Gfo/Idh/MocA family protein n=1 Tax=Candidatus Binatus sp. TaxID=2811406 RepID=UPI003C71D2E6